MIERLFQRDFQNCAGNAVRQPADHIGTVVSRYRGAIPSWDVANGLSPCDCLRAMNAICPVRINGV